MEAAKRAEDRTLNQVQGDAVPADRFAIQADTITL
jgi:hypothetical protein